MKEMTIEEKARRYDEAINAAKDALNDGTISNNTIAYLQDIFNELKESEDERIRKGIIRNLQYLADRAEGFVKDELAERIAWLEKQGEQETDEWKEGNIIRHGGILALVIRGRRVMKSNGEIFTVQYPDEWVKAAPKEIEHFLNEFEKQSEQPQGKTALEAAKEEKVDNQNCAKPADKVEPKFHKGDWIISNDKKSIYQVIEVKRGIYVIRDNADNHEYHIGIEECEKSGRLFTIHYAKNGDVLASGQDIFIFKEIRGAWIYCYCLGDNDGSFMANSYDLMRYNYYDVIHPATKEQHDTLMKAMVDARYAFDFDKKELKKIEQKTVDKIEPKFHVGDWIVQDNIGVYKVIEVCESWYEVIGADDNHYSIGFDNEYMCHLWTINEANDGDVLVDIYNNIGIFQECKGIYWPSYVYLGCDGELRGLSNGGYHRQDGTHPATKEQRDLLFQKMKDAGYKWP